MRKKEEKVVLTFHTTSEAMAFEESCKADAMPGRMIPVPGVISAGCGLAWSAPPDTYTIWETYLHRKQLHYEAIYKAVI